jgi:coenzyme Q-binding protein COQ10
MPEFSTTRRVRHNASDMFDLVADVERYPEFLPLCSGMKLRSRNEQAEGVVVIVADMTVAYKLIRETFRSRATLDRANLQILVEYLEGPFSRMENRWEFHPVQDWLCDVKFFISYEFKSRMLGILMGAMFDTAFRRFAVAFERRADAVYGRRSGATTA